MNDLPYRGKVELTLQDIHAILRRRDPIVFLRHHARLQSGPTQEDRVTFSAHWGLITALRGPDDQPNMSDDKRQTLKSDTTERLRAAILYTPFYRREETLKLIKPPHKLEAPDGYLQDFTPCLVEELLAQYPEASRHFLEHYAYACWWYWQCVQADNLGLLPWKK